MRVLARLVTMSLLLAFGPARGDAPTKPDHFGGGYHGTNEVHPDVALKHGLPARGTSWDLRNHAMQGGNSAFRGTTAMPATPDGEGGAALWADEGGFVYHITNVPTWDVNAHLERTRGANPARPYEGNPWSGEHELAIPARVESWHIKRYGKVERSHSGRLYVPHFIDNPSFGKPEAYAAPN